MLGLKKVAVTGGVATGKSTVCRIFQELGAYVVSADQITHQLLSSNTSLKQQITSLLGDAIFSEGVIDRSKVAKIVFESPALLSKLEALIHPLVKAEVEREWQKAQTKSGYSIFVVEIPLLFEVNWELCYDAIIVVISNEEQSVQRFCLNGNHDKREYFHRMSRQIPPDEKAKKANYVIENNGSLEELKKKVISLYKLLEE